MIQNSPSNAPLQPLQHLDHLWFQVAGTRCNLTCNHCFISCSPKNDNFGFLTLQQVKERLAEAAEFGVKEFYFTGGEPFLNPEMTDILVETLQHGPATVLTNGTVLKDAWLERLSDAEQHGRYSLEFRVSIDGFDAATNDPIRGEGTFARAIEGVAKLSAYGFLPIITATRTWPIANDAQVLAEFTNMLRSHGCARPRFKILPTLQLGAEVERSCGYRDSERVTNDMLKGYDRTQLVCEHSRIVTDRGVHVCPILIDAEDSLLGGSLHDANRPFPLTHGACYTCYQYGSICSNSSAPRRSDGDKGDS